MPCLPVLVVYQSDQFILTSPKFCYSFSGINPCKVFANAEEQMIGRAQLEGLLVEKGNVRMHKYIVLLFPRTHLDVYQTYKDQRLPQLLADFEKQESLYFKTH